MMEKEAFIDEIMRRLGEYWNPSPPDENDVALVRCAAGDCFEDGYTVTDAVLLLRNLEHVDATLDEGVALARMMSITDKYPRLPWRRR